MTRLSGVWSLKLGKLLRLESAPSSLSESEGRTFAWEGFVSFGSGGPAELAGDAPPGHYVAIHAEPSRGVLTLLREPTGGERLYFCVEGDELLFATSLRTLLALRGGEAKLDAENAFERGVSELIHFGDGTLIEGVREVLPGHRLTVEGGRVTQAWAWGSLLEPLKGDPPALARDLRKNLKDAVARCIGREGRAAVALSGGVDSASVAALAAEIVGPENVVALTYEYADPGHPSEVGDAEEICRRLRIRDHRVLPITFDDFVGVAPAAVWTAEDPGYWKRSYPMVLARAARAAGFDRFLTGFGIGSHMGYFGDLAGAASEKWPPEGVEPPVFRLQYPLMTLLRARGALKDLTPLFPAELGPRIEANARSPRVASELAGGESWPLARMLRYQAFIHMNSCADVVRCERLARLTGASWLGPAHFPSSLPYCYLPTSENDALRPGKRLLHEAMREVLPEAVMARKKDWTQTIGSRDWRNRVLARMDAAAGSSWEAMRPLFGPALTAARAYSPEGMIPLAFWHRVFMTRRGAEAPTWRDLEGAR